MWQKTNQRARAVSAPVSFPCTACLGENICQHSSILLLTFDILPVRGWEQTPCWSLRSMWKASRWFSAARTQTGSSADACWRLKSLLIIFLLQSDTHLCSWLVSCWSFSVLMMIIVRWIFKDSWHLPLCNFAIPECHRQVDFSASLLLFRLGLLKVPPTAHLQRSCVVKRRKYTNLFANIRISEHANTHPTGRDVL